MPGKLTRIVGLVAPALFLLCAHAHAQGAVQSMGPVTYGHGSMWVDPGHIMDAGGPTANGQPPLNSVQPGVFRLGSTWVNSGLGQCDFSAYANAPYTSLCLGFDGSGNPLLSVQGFGTSPGSFNINFNGSVYPLIGGGGGNVTGPSSSVSGDLIAFNGTTGKLLEDTGLQPPGSAIVGLTDTQTLTNKTLTAPTITGGTQASPTISNPTLTGVPTAPTAAAGTSTTQVASTAFATSAPTPVLQANSCPSIALYGGKGDGTTDNVAAFAAAVAANPASPCAYFPKGNYLFASAVSYTLPANNIGFTIVGDGKDVSTLFWPNGGGGITIVYAGHQNTVNVQNLTIATGTTGGGIGLTLTQTTQGTSADAPTTINNVAFRGYDGYSATDYWTTNLKTNGVINVNIVEDYFVGTGSFLSTGFNIAATSGVTGTVYNISHSNFVCLDKGIVYNSYVQGVTVTGGNNFTCGNIGIDAIGTTGTDQLIVTDNQFETNTAGILDSGGIPAEVISGNLFITNAANSIGVEHDGNADWNVSNNVFQAGTSGGYGVKATSGAGIVGSNQFVTQGTDIYLGSSTGSVHVLNSNNHLSPITAAITNLNSANVVDGDFSWTPTLLGAGTAGSPTYVLRLGGYSRVGQSITTRFHVSVSSLGSAAGDMEIGAFPFPPNSGGDNGQCVISYASGISTGSSTTTISGLIPAGGTVMQFYQGVVPGAGTAPSQIDASQFGASTEVYGTCSYAL